MQHPDRHSGHLRSETELVLRRSRTSAASLSEHGSSTITPAEHGTACQQPSAYSFLSLFFAVVSFRQAPTAAYIPVPPPLFLLMREHCQKAAGTFIRNNFSSCTNTAKILLMIIGFPVNPLAKEIQPYYHRSNQRTLGSRYLIQFSFLGKSTVY